MTRCLLRLVVALAVFLLAAPQGRAAAQDGSWTIERIVVKRRFAADLGGPARAALSPGGTLAVDEASNSLIVRDSPASVAAVRSVVALLDVEPRSVTVRVRTIEQRYLERSRSDVGVAGSLDSGGEAHLRAGVVLGKDSIAGAARTTQALTVQSGQRAVITLSGTQPVVVGRTRLHDEVGFRDFGSQMTVEPTVLGDGRVRVRLSPRSTTPIDPRSGVARGAGIDTEVVLAPGESLVLGGVDRQAEGGSSAWSAGRAAEHGADSLAYLLDVALVGAGDQAPTVP